MKPLEHEEAQIGQRGRFGGFTVPEQNWFKMPNEWTDITADIDSLAELKVVEYVLKHTWGFHEYGLPKKITIDEFMHGRKRSTGERLDRGTGLSKQSVITGLKKAVQRSLLVENIDASDRARVKKSYMLHMKAKNQALIPTTAHTPTPDSDVQHLDPDVKDLDTGSQTTVHRTEKEPSERSSSRMEENHPSADKTLTNELMQYGLSAAVASQLLRRFGAEHVREKIDYLQYLQNRHPKKIGKPDGWLRKAVEDDYAAPAGFISRGVLEQRDRQRKSTQQAAARRMQVEEEDRNQIAKMREAEQLAAVEKQRTIYDTGEDEVARWTMILDQLKTAMSPLKLRLLKRAHVLIFRDGKLTLAVSSVFDQQHVERIMATEEALVDALRQHLGDEAEIRVNILDHAGSQSSGEIGKERHDPSAPADRSQSTSESAKSGPETPL